MIKMETDGKQIVLKSLKSQKEVIEQLKGCVKDSNINPLDIKKIWQM